MENEFIFQWRAVDEFRMIVFEYYFNASKCTPESLAPNFVLLNNSSSWLGRWGEDREATWRVNTSTDDTRSLTHEGRAYWRIEQVAERITYHVSSFLACKPCQHLDSEQDDSTWITPSTQGAAFQEGSSSSELLRSKHAKGSLPRRGVS